MSQHRAARGSGARRRSRRTPGPTCAGGRSRGWWRTRRSATATPRRWSTGTSRLTFARARARGRPLRPGPHGRRRRARGPGGDLGAELAEWVLAALGALGAGAVLVPLNTRFKGREAAYILRDRRGPRRCSPCAASSASTTRPCWRTRTPARSTRIVLLATRAGPPAPSPDRRASRSSAGDDFLAARRARWTRGTVRRPGGGRRQPGDLSDLIFTSGTTGRPKGAMTTHAQTLRTFGTWASIVGLAEGDRYLVVNPFFHTFGYKAGILACLMAGATIVPEPVFDVDAVLARSRPSGSPCFPGPPTLYQSILDHPGRPTHDLSSLRLAVTGAAVVPVELVVRHADRAQLRHRPHRLRADRVQRHRHHVPPRATRPRSSPHLGPGHPRPRGARRRRRRRRACPRVSRARSSSGATR